MTPDKVIEICDKYMKYFDTLGVDVIKHAKKEVCEGTMMVDNIGQTATAYEHIYWMCAEIKEFVKKEEMDKAFRWLGFVQGVLWCVGEYTINELRDHNRSNV